MTVSTPHFLLFSEARLSRERAKSTLEDGGVWHFVLESVDGTSKLEATDLEPEDDPERLELLAVVRGLEALDQPSRVTLVTRSRSVARGLRFGLDRWRENGWQWECFGRMTPIKHSDLWQRIDQALQFHKVRCRTWRFDAPEESAVPAPKFSRRQQRIDDDTADRPDGRFAALARGLNGCMRALRLSTRGSLAEVE